MVLISILRKSMGYVFRYTLENYGCVLQSDFSLQTNSASCFQGVNKRESRQLTELRMCSGQSHCLVRKKQTSS